MDNSPKQEKEQKELESSQDEIENLVTVQVVRDRKRTVENKESLGHIGQGSSNKVPKSDSATEISEHDVSEDLQRTQLLKHNVVSVRVRKFLSYRLHKVVTLYLGENAHLTECHNGTKW